MAGVDLAGEVLLARGDGDGPVADKGARLVAGALAEAAEERLDLDRAEAAVREVERDLHDRVQVVHDHHGVREAVQLGRAVLRRGGAVEHALQQDLVHADLVQRALQQVRELDPREHRRQVPLRPAHKRRKARVRPPQVPALLHRRGAVAHIRPVHRQLRRKANQRISKSSYNRPVLHDLFSCVQCVWCDDEGGNWMCEESSYKQIGKHRGSLHGAGPCRGWDQRWRGVRHQ